MSDRDLPEQMDLTGRYKPGSEFAVAFGRTVQVLRTDQGLSRGDLAKRAGISYSYLSAIENGSKPPSGQAQQVLAGALGVRVHELMAAAEARLSPTGADVELLQSAEIDEALSRRDRRMASRFVRNEMPRSAAAASPSPSRTELGAINELRSLLPSMSDDDVQFLLEMARRLAGRG